MNNTPLILVHPFFTMDMGDIERYYPKFPHLMHLQQVVSLYQGKIFVLESESTQEAKKILKQWGRRDGYSLRLTFPSDPEPLKGWDSFFAEIEKETPEKKVVIGGGFYEGRGASKGCVGRVIDVSEERGYKVDVIDRLTFSKADVMNSFCVERERVRYI